MSGDDRKVVPLSVEDMKGRLNAGPEWLALVTDGNGKIAANLENTLTALREDPSLRDCIGLDEMTGCDVLLHALPGQHVDPAGRTITDTDILVIQEYLQRSGMTWLQKNTVHDAVDSRAQERRFHPIRDYLQSLEWDGTPRLATWLHDYLGAENGPYTAGIGKMFLIAMVARIMQPGAKCDYMMILESPQQGRLKSTVCQILAGEAYFADNLPKGDKDASMTMSGRWLVEVAELHAFSARDVDHLKALVSRRVEVYRPPYGRKVLREPRQCLLIGTTNRGEYLTDPTGNRRFWPVRIGDINDARLQRDRDQLFAEAFHLYQDGAQWWPDPEFQATHIEAEQAERRDVDVWEPRVLQFVEGKDSVLIQDVLEHLDVELSRRERRHSLRIRDILLANGWWRGRKDRRGYFPYHSPQG